MKAPYTFIRELGAIVGADCMSASQYGQSRSGSVTESPKYDGDSSNDAKFEGEYSTAGNNPHIGERGWGS